MNIRQRLTLLLLLLLAFALRLHHLDVQSLWYDEGVSARVAQMSLSELARWTAADIQPPLYYMLLHGWLKAFAPWPGNIAWLMRFVSASFGLLLLPLLAVLARKLWRICAGLLTTLVAGISPLMVYYSQEARMYTLLLFWLALAAWAVVRLLDENGRVHREKARLQWLALYTLSGVAALYTHYFAGFALLALALYWGHVWLREHRSRRALGGFALANGLILAGFAPWLPLMWQQWRTDTSYWPGKLKLTEALWHLLDNLTVGATEVFFERLARAWLPWFGFAALLGLWGLWQLHRRGRQRPLALVLHWLLLPVLFILVLAWRTPKLNTRYLLVAWPGWALLLGGGAASLWHRRSQWARGLTVAMLLLITLASARGLDNWFHDPNFAKTGWREAVGYAATHHAPDEVALLVSGHAYPIFDLYLPPDAPEKWRMTRFRLPEIEILDVTQVLGWEETARALNANLQGHSGVWLFLWQDEVVDPAQTTRTLLRRYAHQESTPQFAFLGLEHYQLPHDFAVPVQPPLTWPGHTFASGLSLVGVQRAQGGLWLYWQAQQPLPDLQVTLSLQQAGQELAHLDQRPLGYDFPTTHWNRGDTYAQWLPLAQAPTSASLHLRVHDAHTSETWILPLE